MPISPPSTCLAEETIDPLVIAPNRGELMRYLGYPQAKVKSKLLPEHFERALLTGQSALQPRGAYGIYRIDAWKPDCLFLGGASLAGQVATFLNAADRVVAFVVTVGHRISELSREASARGDVATSWALDALGSWAAEAAVEALMLQLTRHVGDSETLSPRYSPGYCGISLTEQEALFKAVPADGIGVTLLPSMLMQPLKSVSGLVGIGSCDRIEQAGVPCRNCDAEHCTMRR